MGLWRQLSDEWRFYRYAEAGHGALSPLKRPGFWLMATHRYGQWAMGVRLPLIGRLLRVLYFLIRWQVSWMTGANIRINAKIGKRFHVHTSHGVLITNGVTIGDDCSINTGACLVNSANSRGEGTPTLGQRVRIGVGAKILGGVSIGDHVIVGANAVVTRDVPSFTCAVGVPAQLRPVSRAYIEEFYSPNYAPRRAGLLPDQTPPDFSHLT